jgi:hypothetical protein
MIAAASAKLALPETRLNVTGRPEVAVAIKENAASPNVLPASGPKAMDCAARATGQSCSSRDPDIDELSHRTSNGTPHSMTHNAA